MKLFGLNLFRRRAAGYNTAIHVRLEGKGPTGITQYDPARAAYQYSGTFVSLGITQDPNTKPQQDSITKPPVLDLDCASKYLSVGNVQSSDLTKIYTHLKSNEFKEGEVKYSQFEKQFIDIVKGMKSESRISPIMANKILENLGCPTLDLQVKQPRNGFFSRLHGAFQVLTNRASAHVPNS